MDQEPPESEHDEREAVLSEMRKLGPPAAWLRPYFGQQVSTFSVQYLRELVQELKEFNQRHGQF